MSETEDYDKSATPAAHKTSHQDGGSDEISVEALAGELTAEQKSAWSKVSGKPTTFPPEAHKTSHQLLGADALSVAGLSGLLADGQTPAAHKTSHQDGGTDEISVTGLSGLLADDQHVLDSEVLAVVEQYLSWMIDIDVFDSPPAAVGALNYAIDSTNLYNGRIYLGAGEQNNEISWPVVLSAGMWTYSQIHFLANAVGIYSVYLDATLLGTIDGYATANTPNVRSLIGGFTVSTTKKYTLKVKMATKNDASSGYYLALHHVRLIRTA